MNQYRNKPNYFPLIKNSKSLSKINPSSLTKTNLFSAPKILALESNNLKRNYFSTISHNINIPCQVLTNSSLIKTKNRKSFLTLINNKNNENSNNKNKYTLFKDKKINVNIIKSKSKSNKSISKSQYNMFNNFGIKEDFLKNEIKLIKIKGEEIKKNDDKLIYLTLMRKFKKTYGIKGNFFINKTINQLSLNEEKKEPIFFTDYSLLSDNNIRINLDLFIKKYSSKNPEKKKINKQYLVSFIDQNGSKQKMKVFKYDKFNNNLTKALDIKNLKNKSFINNENMYGKQKKIFIV